ncbi:MAG: M48 family metalloprotease [Phaeodactylibacter sp.]|nr:M48 family metalloprotease [Phaeodactylibacter sp.]MCB9298644.1 M48 family metalloprotease [Lewinellaceae bacterium]
MRKPAFFLYLRILALGLIALHLQSCATNPVTGKSQLMLLSKDQEIALGEQSDPEIVAAFGRYDNEEIQNFINEKGQQMARVSHRPELKYEFKVLDSPVVNAFALPGGYVYFTRGILAHFNNEAEFAGVLGHEIGHITARHSAQQYSRQILAQVGLVAGMVLSEDFRQYAGLAQQGIGLLFLKFGRDDESESDRLGVEYSTRIGYDAHQMADFFGTLKRLSDQGGQSIPTFLSTHPDPADRNRKVDQLASQWQQKTSGSQYNVNRNEYLRMIDGLTYGEDPRQGYVESGVFYHPELKFQYPIPSGWRVNNMPSQVQMAPEDGKALMLLTLASGQDPAQAADAMLQQYQLTQISRSNETVNGLRAVSVLAEQANEQTQEVVSILAYLIEYEGRVYQILGMSYKQDFNTYTARFRQTMEGFRKLTDPSKMNVKPERIRIHRVDKDTNLRAALQEAGMPGNRHEELAILNGMELNQPLTRGMLIKVVEK